MRGCNEAIKTIAESNNDRDKYPHYNINGNICLALKYRNS